ncbi:MAG: hypothetical protein BWY70_00106 [Bacteroidetes bacterium ADurb.Bin408]|nr:MAG: hypothetical protein BWY70_00106 [Bacteroidetes bacterium ADurb.Bin408]
MKRNLFSLFFLTGIFFLCACAYFPKKFQGIITYDISYPGTDTASNFFITLPKRADFIANKNFLRMDVYNLDYTISVLFNRRKQLMTYLYKGFGDTCYAVRLSQADYLKFYNIIPEITVANTGETKEIAGVATQKAILTFSGKEKSFTEDIFFIPGYHNKAINALTIYAGINKPLLHFRNHEGFLVSAYTAKKVELKKIEDSFFEIPHDYKITTKEEIFSILEKYWQAKENNF